MHCEFPGYGDPRVCERCGREVAGVASGKIYAACLASAGDDEQEQLANRLGIVFTQSGPGTELKAIFADLGITKLEGCQCESHMAQMNAWGAAGCREHLDEIVTWLRDGATQFGWSDKLRAAANAVTTGLYREIEWTDPFPSLVRMAIRRAEEKQSFCS